VATLAAVLLLVSGLVPYHAANATGGAPEIAIAPSSGAVGDYVKVNGLWFVPFTTVTLTYDGTLVGNATTDQDGGFAALFVVPQSAIGSHSVDASDSSDDSASATFQVVPASINVVPTSGPLEGNLVKVSGNGFAQFSNVTVSFDGTPMTTATTDGLGQFGAVFTVPPTSPGGHTILAADTSGNSATATFTAVPSTIVLSPKFGPVGTSVTVQGEGFAQLSTVTVTFSGATVATATTGPAGAFAAEFDVPASTLGPQPVQVVDTASNSASAFFIVTPGGASGGSTTSGGGSITVRPAQGGVGYSLVVNGSGFAQFSPVTVTFDGATVASATTDGSGMFIAAMVVPSSSVGAHVIGANDSNGDSATTPFTVVPVVVSLTPSQGPAGDSVIMMGSGFAQFSLVTVTFDGATMAQVTTKGTGDFRALFTVPPSSSLGPHTVVATDSSGTSASTTFDVQASSIVLDPSSGPAGSSVVVQGQSVAQFSTVTITFDDSVVSTATTDAFGRFEASFLVPPSSVGPHTVKATDSSPAANSATATFNVLLSTSTTMSCSPSSVITGAETECVGTVSGSSPTGTLTFSAGAGGFAPSATCTLTAAGSCYTYFLSNSPGSVGITSTYSGDSVNAPSSGSFSLSVTPAPVFTLTLTCSESSADVGDSTPCAAATSLDSLSGGVTFTTDNSDTFLSMGNCILSSGSCSIDAVGAGVGSTTLTASFGGQSASFGITVNAPSSNTIAYATGSTTIVGGGASFTSFGTIPVTIYITGSGAPTGTVVTAIVQELVSTEPGVAVSTLGSVQYYDVQVEGIADGTAQVCIQQAGADSSSTIQYWDGAEWVTAQYIVVNGTTVCGSMPVSALNGTAIAIGHVPPSNGGITESIGLNSIPLEIELVPDVGATPLSGANYFTITYSSGGASQTINYYPGAPTFIAPDAGSVLTISGSSSGSSASEMWTLNSAGSPTTAQVPTVFSSTPCNLTYYYYDLVLQNVAETVLGGGSPSASLSYVTAPSLASSTDSPTTVSTSLSGTGQQIWAERTSIASAPGSVGGVDGERWTAAQTAWLSWIITGPNSVSSQVAYYHQYSQSIGYSTSDGTTPSSPLNFTFISEGSLATVTLAPTPQAVWMDAGSTVPPQTSQATSGSERWAVNETGLVITGPNVLPSNLSFSHQFLLTTSGLGANAQKQWYDEGSMAVVTTPTTFGRSSGSGFRVTSYSLDGGPSVSAAPTAGIVRVEILMTAAHSISFASVKQYQVSLDSGAVEALSSATPPAIIGDNYWYDAGTSVNLVLNGAWGRSSGSGMRLAGYALNGGTETPVATTAAVTVLTISSLGGPQSVVTDVRTQYQLSAESGSLASITPPPISGDAGWYDAGTAVQAAFNYVWNAAGPQTRQSAVSFSVDGGSTVALTRAGSGVFSVSVVMNGTHSVSINSATQYSLSITGGASPIVAPPSPTNDNFYDSSTVVTVTAPVVWNVTSAGTRQSLASYTLDGAASQIPSNASGDFAIQGIAMDTAHRNT
jgi:hypothetical protein